MVDTQWDYVDIWGGHNQNTSKSHEACTHLNSNHVMIENQTEQIGLVKSLHNTSERTVLLMKIQSKFLFRSPERSMGEQSVLTLRAQIYLCFFSLTRNTLPNFPLPKGLPISKSSNVNFLYVFSAIPLHLVIAPCQINKVVQTGSPKFA